MTTHSSVLAWRIPGMGSHRVGHDRSDLPVAGLQGAAGISGAGANLDKRRGQRVAEGLQMMVTWVAVDLNF